MQDIKEIEKAAKEANQALWDAKKIREAEIFKEFAKVECRDVYGSNPRNTLGKG